MEGGQLWQAEVHHEAAPPITNDVAKISSNLICHGSRSSSKHTAGSWNQDSITRSGRSNFVGALPLENRIL
eukprot:360371-Karenia_brevis.AAC.1